MVVGIYHQAILTRSNERGAIKLNSIQTRSLLLSSWIVYRLVSRICVSRTLFLSHVKYSNYTLFSKIIGEANMQLKNGTIVCITIESTPPNAYPRACATRTATVLPTWMYIYLCELKTSYIHASIHKDQINSKLASVQ